MPQTKDDIAAYNRRHYKINRVAIRARHASYDPQRVREHGLKHAFKCTQDGRAALKGARFRARKLGLPFNLTHEFMLSLWPKTGRDFYGEPMSWKSERDGKKCIRPDSPTIDRLEPSLGYVKGNVIWLSAKSNLLKGGESVEAKRKFVAAFDAGILGRP